MVHFNDCNVAADQLKDTFYMYLFLNFLIPVLQKETQCILMLCLDKCTNHILQLKLKLNPLRT